MATTQKGIYYNIDYNSVADVLEDERLMAESIDTAIENSETETERNINALKGRVSTLETDNTTNKSSIATLKGNVSDLDTNKVDKIEGKGLSTNDYTNEEQNKLANLENYDDTEVKENIEAIEEEQTVQNTNIETLQAENETLKSIINQLPQVSGSGTEVTLNNTIEAPMTQFDVEGNSTQESTEGYQLLSFNDLQTQTINGVTITNNGDGNITLNGTSTGSISLKISDSMNTLKSR